MESQTVFEAKRNYKTPSFSCKGPFIPMYKPVTTEFVPTGNFDPATFAYYCFCFSAGAVLWLAGSAAWQNWQEKKETRKKKGIATQTSNTRVFLNELIDWDVEIYMGSTLSYSYWNNLSQMIDYIPILVTDQMLVILVTAKAHCLSILCTHKSVEASPTFASPQGGVRKHCVKGARMDLWTLKTGLVRGKRTPSRQPQKIESKSVLVYMSRTFSTPTPLPPGRRDPAFPSSPEQGQKKKTAAVTIKKSFWHKNGVVLGLASGPRGYDLPLSRPRPRLGHQKQFTDCPRWEHHENNPLCHAQTRGMWFFWQNTHTHWKHTCYIHTRNFSTFTKMSYQC